MPHKSRRREARFAEFLTCRLGGDIVNERFKLDPEVLASRLSKQRLLSCLQADCHLPAVKREQCMDLIRTLPAEIQVAMEPSRVSFDVVVQQDGRPYFWSFMNRNIAD